MKKSIIESISDKHLSYFFISLSLTLSFYYFLLFSLFFNLTLSYLTYLSETYTFFFCRHIWAELSFLFWTFLSAELFPGGGGGGVHVHPVHPPPAYAPGRVTEIEINIARRRGALDDYYLKWKNIVNWLQGSV